MYLVIDTCIWEKAGSGDPYALSILSTIQIKCEHKIVYDYECEIINEYRRHIKDPALIKLFTKMTQTGKITPKSKTNINNTKIEKFDKSDLKFIQVALSSSALIITEDSDFFAIQNALKERGLNVEVLSPKEALNRL